MPSGARRTADERALILTINRTAALPGWKWKVASNRPGAKHPFPFGYAGAAAFFANRPQFKIIGRGHVWQVLRILSSSADMLVGVHPTPDAALADACTRMRLLTVASRPR